MDINPCNLDPTPYPDVNAVVRELQAGLQDILGEDLVGLYLYGSLAGGDFDPRTSDIDFVAVAAGRLSDEVIAALRAMHERLAAGPSKWGTELEGYYIPLCDLRRYNPAQAPCPHIERGEKLVVEPQASDGVILRHIVREQGIVLAGPDPHPLIDPVSPDELGAAVRELFRGWWVPMVQDPVKLYHPGYHAYAVLTMCRMRYTLKYGTIVSKPAAARWALATWDARWAPLIERALAWQMRVEDVDETRALIEETAEAIHA
jgi:hypothetical protein